MRRNLKYRLGLFWIAGLAGWACALTGAVPELIRPGTPPVPSLIRPSLPKADPALRRLPKSLLDRIEIAAQRASLDPKFVEAVVWAESAGSREAVSPKGAMGLMQVMPKTADACGIHNAFHAVDNLMGACRCLRSLINRYRGDLKLALAAYNAGPKHVDRVHGVPAFRETQLYVKKILNRYRTLQMQR